ncbi:MAG: GAF domain-containing protein [Syntrophaceae bacterium]|nr:GAF domain-containing protein [Syntrophaceae bacterium]
MAAKKEGKDFFQTIKKVSRALGTTLERDKLLDLIVRSAMEAMDAKAAALFLADEKTKQYVAAAQKGLSRKYQHAGPGHVDRVPQELMKKGYLHYRDAVNDKRLENRDLKKAEGIGSILTVPVMVNDRPIGVLSLYTADIRDFSKEEIEFLTTLAEQGGMAVEHARLLETIRANIRISLELLSAINSSLDIRVILQTMTEKVALALGVKAASIRLLNDDRTELRLAASYGLSEKYINKGPIYAERSIAEALSGVPVVVKDAARDKGVQYRKEKVQEGIVSILCVPIKAREDVIGVLRLYTDAPREFSDLEILQVSVLAHHGGLAIQNASLYMMLQNDLKGMKDDAWSHRCWF